MLETIHALRAEQQQLQQELQNPATASNSKELARIGKRLKELAPILAKGAEYERAERSLRAVAEAGDDPELRTLAEEEAANARALLPQLEAELRTMLVPRDPLDERNVILEVRAGTGGEEAALFAAELLRMYLRYSENQGWQSSLLSEAAAEAGGLKEAVIRISGDGVFGKLKFEGGVHRVQRIPATEAKGRVHTSAATVAVLPEAEEQDLQVRTEDLRVDTFRSGGAGGQHVNKTESAVRITHIPTGVVVSCQSERSQVQNRARALELLRTRLYAAREEAQHASQGDLRREQVKGGDRSDKIRTYNFPQDRLTDHRIGENFHNLPKIMEGELEPVVTALQEWRLHRVSS